MPYYLHTKDVPCYGEGIAYATRADAAIAGKTWAPGSWAITYLPTATELEDWQAREQARFDTDEYKPIPWASDDWYQPLRLVHFCHVSIDKPGLVAYTADIEKGIANRKIRITPGRYLEQFAPDLSHAIRDVYIASVKAITVSYKLATTADEIVYAYRNGPSSCMGRSNFSDNEDHPCRVYGDSDLAVAYLERPDEDNPVYARCVVWPDRHIYTRLYGDEATLRVLLESDGYTNGDLHGARIRRIEYPRNGEHLVMPYIDAAVAAEILDDTYLRLCRHGDISTKETDGRASIESERIQYCGHCENEMPYDEDNSYCESCENSRSYCEACDTDTWNDTIEVGNRQICEDCARAIRQSCTSCSEYWWNENLTPDAIAERVRYHVTDYCPDCADDLTVCPECDEEITGRYTLVCPDCGITLRYRCDLTLPLPFDLATVNNSHSAYVGALESAF